jgi:hypothetical protein
MKIQIEREENYQESIDLLKNKFQNTIKFLYRILKFSHQHTSIILVVSYSCNFQISQT